jgi:CheY-like chemotaxis protein
MHVTSISKSSHLAPKMLIADDDPCVVKALAERCTRMGFKVETAANGLQALIKTSQCKPDILVIDVHMPEVDGLSVCAHLSDPIKKSLGVIVMTGHANPDTVAWCEEFGAIHTHKDPHFWKTFEAALCEMFPSQASRIRLAREPWPTTAIKRRARVLVVDDDASVRRFLYTKLKQVGVVPLCAVDGTSGFWRARREEPTVIVSDYFMQDGDAEYLLLRLRVAPETRNIPVIVQSGRPLNNSIKQRLRQEIYGRPGAARILQKSSGAGELLEVVQRYCGFATDPVAQIQ